MGIGEMMLDPIVFWRLTPRDFYRMERGYFRRMERQNLLLREVYAAFWNVNRSVDQYPDGVPSRELYPMSIDPKVEPETINKPKVDPARIKKNQEDHLLAIRAMREGKNQKSNL